MKEEDENIKIAESDDFCGPTGCLGPTGPTGLTGSAGSASYKDMADLFYCTETERAEKEKRKNFLIGAMSIIISVILAYGLVCLICDEENASKKNIQNSDFVIDNLNDYEVVSP